MPPQLRHGIPVGQRKHLLPSAVRLCQCYLCAESNVIDPVKGHLVKGRYLGNEEYKRHRSLEKKSGATAADSAAAVNTSVLPGDSHPITSMPHSESKSAAASVSASAQPGTGAIQESPLSASSEIPFPSVLDSVFESLESKSVDDIFTGADLMFLHPPFPGASSPLAPGPRDPAANPTQNREANVGPFALFSTFAPNSRIIGYEEWLLQSYQLIREHGENHRETRVRLRSVIVLRRIDSDLDEIEERKRQEWERQRLALPSEETFTVQDACTVDSGSIFQSRGYLELMNLTAIYMNASWANADPIAIICYIVVAALHLFSHLSMDHCGFLLRSFYLILSLAIPLPEAGRQSTLSSIHSDIRTVLDQMNLNPATKAYICCPRCFKCYPLTPDAPIRCTNQDTPSSTICNRLLRKTVTGKGTPRSIPSRQFLYHDMKQWLARLYCRPGMEEYLDRNVFDKTGPSGRDPGLHHDIWDAPALRSFVGPDGRTPFMERPEGEGRLMFSLSMDGFNPYQMKEAGKKVTIGAIYMVCLNLPPAIRYKAENMYLVGIIPGPKEPSLHQINHLLSPLVDDLLDLWHDGIFITQTPHHRRGRRVRCALGPLVCDLPAARQMGGMASHLSRHFCSCCLLKLDDIENLDFENWPRRSQKDHRFVAQQWREASTEDLRDGIFEEHGLRWTELLRLKYWDPTLFIVVDSMHAFLLGMLKRHVRDIWGMDVRFHDGDGKSFDKSKNPPTDDEMQEAHKILRVGTPAALRKLRKDVLRQLCRETQSMRFAYKKKRLVENLLEYVSLFLVLMSMSSTHFQLQRIQRGWFTTEGRVIVPGDSQSGPPTPTSAQSKPSKTLEVDLTRATTVLETRGSKNSLKTLRKAALVALCTVKLQRAAKYDYNRDTVNTLISKLTEWVCTYARSPSPA